LIGAALPSSAAIIAGSLPSMPSAQMPSPRSPYLFTSWALRATDCGLSKYASCHWLAGAW
jgi:hypothetical protein